MTARTVLLALVASDDVLGILDHVAVTRGVEPALEVDRQIDRAISSLTSHATRGRIVPELRSRGISTYREIMTTPYRILYRIVGQQVRVVAVFDHRRNADELLRERSMRDRDR